MQLAWIKPLLGQKGPFATVYIGRSTGGGDKNDSFARWQILRKQLVSEGATEGVLAHLDEAIYEGVREDNGAGGRILIANEDVLFIDRTVGATPVKDECIWSPTPSLVPAIIAADEMVSSLIVTVDRQGGDIEWFDPQTMSRPVIEIVDGEHDVVNKTQMRGRSHLKMSNRAEDSWNKNADAVIDRMERRILDLHPELIVLTGDVKACSLIMSRAAKSVSDQIVEIRGGVRGHDNGSNFKQELAEQIERVRSIRRDAIVEKFKELALVGRAATTGLTNVIHALQRAQVSELVVNREFLNHLKEEELWVGVHPLAVAKDEESIITIAGVTQGNRLTRADVALIRAALGGDAGVTIISQSDVMLEDGIGAILRWVDNSALRVDVSQNVGEDHHSVRVS